MLTSTSVYQIEKDFDLSSSLLESLAKLYQPIIGADAILLYLTIFYDTQDTHENLSNLLNKDLIMIEKARFKLEEVYLIETYQKDSEYLYIIKEPLEYQHFLAHEVLGRLLIEKMGKIYFQVSLSKTAVVDKQEWLNISKKFNSDFLNNWKKEQEEVFQKKAINKKTKNENQLLLFQGISNLMFPYELRTASNVNVILDLAELYEVPLDTIRTLAFQSVDVANSVFLVDKFKMKVRKQKIEKQEKHPYDMACSSFLARYQNSGNISDVNLKFLETLKAKFNLKNEVINVLIEYVLKQYNMDLNRPVLETIAARFDRITPRIETYEQATEALKRNQTPYKSKTEKGKNTSPDWITRNPQSKDGKLTEEIISDEEFNKILKGLAQ